MFEKKSIAILYAGGRKRKFNNSAVFDRWSKGFFELEMIADATPILIEKEPYPVNTKHLLRVARRIKREWNKYHGFVVTLPRRNFLIMANLLAFMIDDVGKPIVITSAPEENLPNDVYGDIGLKANIVNATQAAVVQSGGVMVVVGPQLIPPPYAFYSGIPRGIHNETIDSINKKYIGRIDFGIQLDELAKKYNPDIKPDLQLDHAENVLYFDLRKKKFDKEEKLPKVDGVVLEFQNAVDKSVLRLIPKNIPIMAISGKEIQMVEKGSTTKITTLSPAAAAGKFIWVLGQKKRKDLDKEQKKLSLQDWMNNQFIDEFI